MWSPVLFFCRPGLPFGFCFWLLGLDALNAASASESQCSAAYFQLQGIGPSDMLAAVRVEGACVCLDKGRAGMLYALLRLLSPLALFCI